jgi:hypothetical protein
MPFDVLQVKPLLACWSISAKLMKAEYGNTVKVVAVFTIPFPEVA